MHGHAREGGVEVRHGGGPELVHDLGHSRAVESRLAQKEAVDEGRGSGIRVAVHAALRGVVVGPRIAQVVRQREEEGRRGRMLRQVALLLSHRGLAIGVHVGGIEYLARGRGPVQEQRKAGVLLQDAGAVLAGSDSQGQWATRGGQEGALPGVTALPMHVAVVVGGAVDLGSGLVRGGDGDEGVLLVSDVTEVRHIHCGDREGKLRVGQSVKCQYGKPARMNARVLPDENWHTSTIERIWWILNGNQIAPIIFPLNQIAFQNYCIMIL
mmetsp:Transcript_33348/g.48326  ORF Transcript_33348/g.48326 Transcript_33348/m.48326 type:complete len:268 (+) Transcript_33348:646-1449(+)